ncbi:MAG: type II toxin-antitoxin system HicA family toxin [Sphaerobacter sp.]|nr:type II toxin-antitoxin system HicA family toxin [Sphaerobacter sp.]
MSRRERRIARIRARPAAAELRDVHALLLAFGWRLRAENSSHAVFAKPGEAPISVPKVHERQVKRTYLDMICQRLGLDD